MKNKNRPFQQFPKLGSLQGTHTHTDRRNANPHAATPHRVVDPPWGPPARLQNMPGPAAFARHSLVSIALRIVLPLCFVAPSRFSACVFLLVFQEAGLDQVSGTNFEYSLSPQNLHRDFYKAKLLNIDPWDAIDGSVGFNGIVSVLRLLCWP